MFGGKQLNHFTIITVVKNDLIGLKRTRASIETQIFSNWTHIIIDGGSTDGTIQYLESLPTRNTSFLSESDNGIYDAMNKGWKLADDESFIFFLNARDQMVNSNSLFFADIALSASPSSNWGCTTHEERNEDGSGWVCKLVSHPSVSNQLYAFGYRSHQAVVMKKKLIEKLGGFDLTYKIASDWELFVKAILEEPPVLWTHPIALFELGGFSSNRILQAHMELATLRKIYLPHHLKFRFFNFLWEIWIFSLLGHKNIFTRGLSILQTLKSQLESSRMKIRIWASNWGFNIFAKKLVSVLLPYFQKRRNANRSTLRRNLEYQGLLSGIRKELGQLPYDRP